jgi:hypothetical protein
LGQVVQAAFLFAVFVAAVKGGVNAVCHAYVDMDPFWVLFTLVVWGGIIGTVWLVICMIWEDQI